MRVIAGRAKGRLLVAPKGLAVRPTSDKVKGAIFSMIEAIALIRVETSPSSVPWPFLNVLDLYAGTGALGIEALSRGSSHVDFVEPSNHARQALAENLARTAFGPLATIHARRAQAALSTLSGPYDLILLDPPYDDPSISSVLEILGASTLLAPTALVIAEHSRSRSLPAQAGALVLARSRYHGQTAISLFLVPTSDPPGEQAQTLDAAF